MSFGARREEQPGRGPCSLYSNRHRSAAWESQNLNSGLFHAFQPIS